MGNQLIADIAEYLGMTMDPNESIPKRCQAISAAMKFSREQNNELVRLVEELFTIS